MASVVVEIEIEELRRLMAVAGETFDKNDLLDAIGMRALGWIDENFESEGGLVGGWDPLSPNTIASKGSSKILVDKGKLRQSLDAYHLEGDEVVIGTELPYAKYHQEGTDPYTIEPKRPGGYLRFKLASGWVTVKEVNHPGLPQRRFLPNQDEGETLAMGLINARLEILRGEN